MPIIAKTDSNGVFIFLSGGKWNKSFTFRGKKIVRLWDWGLFLSLPFHKGIEIELNFSKSFSGLYCDFNWSRKCDHAGIMFGVDIGLIDFDFNFYDSRHWNDNEDRYYLPGEDDWDPEETTSYTELGVYEEVGDISICSKTIDKDKHEKRMREILDKANLTLVEEDKEDK